MKFRKLSKEELQPLESEMISYLSLNGITGQDWQKLVTNDPVAAEAYLNQFSELVWIKIFTNKKYIDLNAEGCNFYYDFLPQEINVVKFEKSDVQEDSIIGFQKMNFAKSREEDMFDLMQQGGTFSDGKAYKEACLLWASAKK